MAKVVASPHPLVLVHYIQCFWRAAVDDSPCFGTYCRYNISIRGTVRGLFVECQPVIRCPTSADLPNSSSSEFLSFHVQVAAIREVPDIHRLPPSRENRPAF